MAMLESKLRCPIKQQNNMLMEDHVPHTKINDKDVVPMNWEGGDRGRAVNRSIG